MLTREPPHLTQQEIASFLAAKTIAAATAFLDGRSDGAALARDADRLCGELLVVSSEPDCNALADPTRLLVIAMRRASVATGTRALRWRAIMIAFVDLVRNEATELRLAAEARVRETRQ